MFDRKRFCERSYYVPFIIFMVLMAVGSLLGDLLKGNWVVEQSQYWVKPAQTLICGAALLYFWRCYEFFSWKKQLHSLSIGIGVGILAFIIWVAPQQLFGAPSRTDGFNPAFFGSEGWPYWLNVGFRFVRLAIVVPLIEEIFWRGFLLRWLVKDDFTTVPFGTFTWKSFGLVSLFFALEHAPVDYPAAILTGLLFNWVAIKTRHLGACVAAHAVTNLLLGFYIMRTEQWGFW